MLVSAGMASVLAHGPVFLENGGQWPEGVQFRAEVPGGALFLDAEGMTWHFVELPEALRRHGESGPDTKRPVPHRLQADRPPVNASAGTSAAPIADSVSAHAVKVVLEGVEVPLHWRAEAPLPGRTHMLRGSDPSNWGQDLQRYERLRCRLKPGVELVLYGGPGDLKYDLILEPGAELGNLAFRYEGLEAAELDDGRMLLHTSLNSLVEEAPYAYQDFPEARKPVDCAYTLEALQEGAELQYRMRFDLDRRYDRSRSLVIDPVTWVFGSYSGSTSDNWGYSATYDNDGNLYGAGIVFGIGYPSTIGAYQTTWAGGAGGLGCDVGITKFSADGSTNLWSTYLGGAANELPHSLVVNDAGELWIYGTTGSSDYPVTPTAYDGSFAAGPNETVTGVAFTLGSDLFVSQLSADGSTLLASTYVGGTANDGLNTGATEGNYGDHARGEIVLDDLGRPVVASCTRSADFPTSTGAFQTAFGGGLQDAVLFRLSADASALEWSTYLGGSGDEGAYSVKLSASGEAIVAGGTESPDFPTTPGVLSPGPAGGLDGWLARMSTDGSSMLAGTYLGSPQYDQAYFTALDADGNIYLCGQTRSASFPVTPGVYSNPGSWQFVARMADDFSGLVYSTVFGSGLGKVDLSPTAFLVDQCGNIYVSGWGGVTNFIGNTNGLPVTPDALQSSTDGSDFYFTVFESGLSSLLFASYYGGNFSNEHVDGGTSRFDEEGAIYQAVCAGCGGFSDFPTTPGVVSTTNNAPNCNLGVAKIALDFTGVTAELDVSTDTIGCAPYLAEFVNASSPGADYIWDFGDGSPTSTAFEPNHLYAVPGTYTVQLIAIDSASCNLVDTAFLTLDIITDSTEALFDLTVEDFCDSVVISASNNSLTVGAASYAWSFGDGSSSSLAEPTHVYTVPGTYLVTLVVLDPLSCNGGDTAFSSVTVSPRSIAAFTAGSGCAPLSLDLVNASSGVDPAYAWDFGDGSTSSDSAATHTWTAPGVYPVQLIVEDPASCNGGDTLVLDVEVFATPDAAFTATPSTGSFFQDIVFDASDPTAQTWTWDFGDGFFAFTQQTEHQYAEPGEYLVCLEVDNNGCIDTACRVIRLDADSELLFPTAFSPNGDGVNDEFLPFQWGLEGYLLRIYNRWGQVVFESNDPEIGWDGRFKGEEQEVGVYKVTASGRGLDGRSYTAVSDLTLVR
jgi:gliding motility-associated-like protein